MDQKNQRGVKQSWRELARILKEKDFWRLRTGSPGCMRRSQEACMRTQAYISKRFHVDNNEMVVEKDITFYSFASIICLFWEKSMWAYVPDGTVVGLSKIARTVEVLPEDRSFRSA